MDCRGLGKTTFANSFAPMYTVIDDPKSLDQLPEKFSNLIITDPYFCITKIRNNVEKILKEKYLDCSINWIFFENDPIQCHINAREKKVHNFIDMLSNHYMIPKRSLQHKVYRQNE